LILHQLTRNGGGGRRQNAGIAVTTQSGFILVKYPSFSRYVSPSLPFSSLLTPAIMSRVHFAADGTETKVSSEVSVLFIGKEE
jgi:hypothetical protein